MANKRFWEFKAKKVNDQNVGELYLYGIITNMIFWGDEVTPKGFNQELKDLGEIDVLNIYINSPGGNVFAGQTIYSILKRHPAAKNVYVDGIAASMASVIAMVGKVFMPKNATMMIHNPMAGIDGNATALRKMADDLDIVRVGMLAAYTEKTGLSEEEIIPLLDAETLMSAEDAFKNGFADEVLGENKIAASLNGEFLVYGDVKIDVSKFKNFDSMKGNFESVKPDEHRAATPTPEPVSIDPKVLTEQQKVFNRIRNKILNQ